MLSECIQHEQLHATGCTSRQKRYAAIKGRKWGRLEIRAVIGRRGSVWSVSMVRISTGVKRLDYSIKGQQYNWSKHSVSITSVCRYAVYSLYEFCTQK